MNSMASRKLEINRKGQRISWIHFQSEAEGMMYNEYKITEPGGLII
jgi:hypothetical protein